jgi:hypothetical protein
MNLFDPGYYRYGQGLRSRGSVPDRGYELEDATDQLIAELRQVNPSMRLIRRNEPINVNGQRALSTYFSTDSPLGGRETDWLISTRF